MPFDSSLPKVFLAVDRISNRVKNLPRRHPDARPLPPWDPTVCNPFEQEQINYAFSWLAISQIPEIERRGGDWKKLADLMKTKTVNSISITCAWCREGKPMSSSTAADRSRASAATASTARTGAGTRLGRTSIPNGVQRLLRGLMPRPAERQSLQVCLDTGNRDFLAAWLVVEVVHLCGGTDLDAWAVKNWLFNVGKSSYPYWYRPLLSSELELMCKGSTPVPPLNFRAGKFTVWDNVGGRLWPSDRAHATTNFPVPWYGPSLIDAGLPRSFWQWPC